MNGDGAVDEDDVTALQKYVVNPESYPLTEEARAAADLNEDGAVDAKDILLLRRRALL